MHAIMIFTACEEGSDTKMNTWEYTSLFYYYQGEQHATEEDRIKTAFTIDWLIDQGIQEQELYDLVQKYPIGTMSITYNNLPDTLWDCGSTQLNVKGQLIETPLNLIQRDTMYCHNALRTYPKVLPSHMKTFMEPRLKFSVNDLYNYIISTLELDRKYLTEESWTNGLLFSHLSAKKYEKLGIKALDLLLYNIDAMNEVHDLTLYNTQGRFQFKPEYIEYAEQKSKQRQASHTDKPLWRTQVWHG